MTPQFHYLKRIRVLVLASALALLLGVASVATPQGDVRGLGGGGLMCGYYTDAATGVTHMMTGRYSVGRRRWLSEPVADVATVTLVTTPITGGNPSVVLKADCIDIARHAMLSDAASCGLPGADALVESALTSTAGIAEKVYWWRYPVALLRRAGPLLVLLGCAGLVVYLQLESRRKRRFAFRREGAGGPLCAHCGYELAGLTPGNGGAARTVCPECGKADVRERMHRLPLAHFVDPLLPILIAVLVIVALGAMSRQ